MRFPLAYETPSGLVLLERVLGTGAQAHSKRLAADPADPPSTSTASCPDQPLDMFKAVYALRRGRPPSLAQMPAGAQPPKPDRQPPPISLTRSFKRRIFK